MLLLLMILLKSITVVVVVGDGAPLFPHSCSRRSCSCSSASPARCSSRRGQREHPANCGQGKSCHQCTLDATARGKQSRLASQPMLFLFFQMPSFSFSLKMEKKRPFSHRETSRAQRESELRWDLFHLLQLPTQRKDEKRKCKARLWARRGASFPPLFFFSLGGATLFFLRRRRSSLEQLSLSLN